MKVTITYLRLKSPFKFFSLAQSALNITKQINLTNCLEYKKTGFWTKHYTMTRWNSEEDLKEFAKSGAHRESMKNSGKIASEIKTLTIDAEKLPDWRTAKAMLEDVKPLIYS